jgi:hypothetical protein
MTRALKKWFSRVSGWLSRTSLRNLGNRGRARRARPDLSGYVHVAVPNITLEFRELRPGPMGPAGSLGIHVAVPNITPEFRESRPDPEGPAGSLGIHMAVKNITPEFRESRPPCTFRSYFFSTCILNYFNSKLQTNQNK